jgi:nucleotide-binding universal stress UspA family protein
MKKILLAFDGQHFSKGIFEFARQMNEHQRVLVTGLFLPSVDYAELLYSFGGVVAGPLYVGDVVPADDRILKKNIAHFRELCKGSGINYKVHTDFTKHVVTHVKEESRFADLFVMSSKLFYENLGEDAQDDYIESVLHKAECPVVLVPEKYMAPKSIVLAYDGSEQSVYAIKQFSYLLPEYRDLKVLLIYLDKGKEELPGKALIEELLSGYFPTYSVFKLKLDPKKDLEQWLTDHGDTMLVAGAYGRSLFSELFHQSFIHEVINDHKVPVFVAHK